MYTIKNIKNDIREKAEPKNLYEIRPNKLNKTPNSKMLKRAVFFE